MVELKQVDHGYDVAIGHLHVDGDYGRNALEGSAFATDLPGPRAVAEAFTRRHPDLKPSGSVNHGYAVGTAFAAIMEKACAERDPTRDGMLRAFQETDQVDTDGLAVIANLFEVGTGQAQGHPRQVVSPARAGEYRWA